MSHFHTPPVSGTASAALSTGLCHGALTKRWHVDLMRVCTDACRRAMR